ncbi:MAG: hypothetical protein FJZ98_05795 [Chloroflexi bacterium]|nr:hypothetical protein [Chloroflexota bacterium]
MPSKQLFVTSLIILLIGISCTLPFYFGAPVEPEKEIVYVEVTAEPTTVNDEPAPVGPTPAVAVNMDGEWTIWYGSTEKLLKISFLQKGYSLVGNAATGSGDSLLFNGTINQASDGVTGTWESTDGTSGSFTIKLGEGLTTFSGNMGGGVPFCGSRSGSKPATCLE